MLLYQISGSSAARCDVLVLQPGDSRWNVSQGLDLAEVAGAATAGEALFSGHVGRTCSLILVKHNVMGLCIVIPEGT